MSGEVGTGAALRIDRTHDADRVAVRVLDDGVTGTAERIVRPLLADITEGGQLGVEAVDSFAAGDLEADHRAPGLPAGIPVPGELGAVEVEIQAARHAGASMVDLKVGLGVRDVQSEPAVERHGGMHVRNDEVQLIKQRAVVHKKPAITRVARRHYLPPAWSPTGSVRATFVAQANHQPA